MSGEGDTLLWFPPAETAQVPEQDLGSPPPRPPRKKKTEEKKEEIEEKKEEEEVDRLSEAVAELLETEQSYVLHLKAAVEVYQKQLEQSKLLTREQVSLIFTNWLELLAVNTILLGDMDEAARKRAAGASGAWAPLFDSWGSLLSRPYKSYCAGYMHAFSVIQEQIRKKPALSTYLEVLSTDPRVGKLTLHSFLIMPVQRIPRYRMLLNEIQRHMSENDVDRPALTAALDAVGVLADEVNASIASVAEVEQLLMLERRFSRPPDEAVFKPGRRLLKYGVVTKVCRKEDKPRVFFLFNDALMYVTVASGRPGESSAVYTKQTMIPLQQCTVKDDKENQWQIISPAKSFTVHVDSKEEKEAWMEALSSTIARSKGEAAVLADGSLAPVWAPDRTTDECPFCHTPFTVLFRRHHCRSCGTLVCANCSKQRQQLKNISKQKLVRVCDVCAGQVVDSPKQDGRGRSRSMFGSMFVDRKPT